jgi:MFS family permease
MDHISAGDGRAGKLWSRDYLLLMISDSFLFFGNSLLLPVLPVYLKLNGANNLQIGAVAGVFFVASIFMRIMTSRVSARLGKRTLLLLGIAVFALAMLGYYLFAGLMMILALRLVQGLSFGASTTLYGSLAADAIPFERMGEGIGYYGLGMTICAAIGPFLGGVAVSLPDFKWVFLAAAGLQLIALLLSVFIRADNRRMPVEKKAGMKDFLSDFVEPKAFHPGIFMLLLGLALGGFSTYVVMYGRERNMGYISWYFLATAVTEFLIRLFSGRLYDRKGLNFVLAPAAAAGVLGCLVMANAASLSMVIISAMLCGTAFGVIFPVLEAVAMKNAGRERRMAANATIFNSLDIGFALGPLLFGAMVQLSGYHDAFILSGLSFAAMLAIIAVGAAAKKRGKAVSAE